MLFFKPEMSAASRERLYLEARLGRALEEGHLHVYYQPRVELTGGRIVGAEALLRWTDPTLGGISPSRFIPLLEESGQIIEVGQWLLARLAADRRIWSASGLGALRLSVNVSPVQLRQHSFSHEVTKALETFDGSADCLELEITESVLLPDLDEHLWHLRALSERGVRIAIDDFGTGYSSLSRLRSLPISTIKIDRSFVVKMTQTQKAINIVSTIIALAKSMQLDVVAEGVDEPQQIDLLRSLHCDEVQGFLISPAVSAEDFAQLLDHYRCEL